jgi:hypothetical protein
LLSNIFTLSSSTYASNHSFTPIQNYRQNDSFVLF